MPIPPRSLRHAPMRRHDPAAEQPHPSHLPSQDTTHVPHARPSIAEQITDTVKPLIATHQYEYIVATANNYGKDIIPRIAGYYMAQPITDITQIIDPHTFIRPIYAGNALSKLTTKQPINFLTFRPSNFQPLSLSPDTPSPITLCPTPPCRTTFLSANEGDSSRPQLTTARIVVSGGRGVKNKENFSLIHDLANALGDAAIGASRAAVDAGYCPNDLQVGQTGKVVAPQLYIAVGISGAVQHLAGMKDSKCIVAINNRPDQPIFEIATYGLQADLFVAVPQLIEKIKKHKAN